MYHIKRLITLALLFIALTPSIKAEDFSAKDVVLEHIQDSHDWHITDLVNSDGEKVPLAIPLPVIVKSSTGWHMFLSSRFEHHAHDGLRHMKIDAPYNIQSLAIDVEGENAGKIVENGEPVLDFSITKTVAVMFINVALLLFCILFSARWYKRHKASDNAPDGFVGFIEMLVMYVVDDIIKPGVGKGYEKYVPYLLTCFFFIFTCNVMGLIPFPPGSGNVTGNIAVTFVLALCTFVVVQFSGSKHYWKDIFWPDVPFLLKCPVPLMPVIEFVGKFETIISLNAFNGNPLFLKLIHYSEEKQVRRIGGLFGISTQNPEAGVFIDGGVLKQSQIRISNTFTGNDLHIDLDSFTGMSHLLIGFGLVRIFLFDCYEPFAFQNPPKGFNASGVPTCSQLAPKFDHS